jgi:hypothetical protein
VETPLATVYWIKSKSFYFNFFPKEELLYLIYNQLKQIIMNQETSFEAKGFVLGNLWGGGVGAYPSIRLEGQTKEEIIEQAKSELSTGGLDSGMGFESLSGAVLNITKVTRLEIDGMPFVNKQTEVELIGNLDEMDQEFLLDMVDKSGI